MKDLKLLYTGKTKNVYELENGNQSKHGVRIAKPVYF